MRSSRIGFLVALCALAIGAGVAHAGYSANYYVSTFKSTTTTLSSGNLRAVRTAPDSSQYIGCTRYSYNTGSVSVVCFARDAAGVYSSCTSTDPGMIRTAELLNPASYVSFQFYNTESICANIIATNASSYLPAQ